MNDALGVMCLSCSLFYPSEFTKMKQLSDLTRRRGGCLRRHEMCFAICVSLESSTELTFTHKIGALLKVVSAVDLQNEPDRPLSEVFIAESSMKTTVWKRS